MTGRRDKRLANAGGFLYYLRMTVNQPTIEPVRFFADLADANGLIDLFRTLPGIHFFAKDRAGQFVAANRPSLLRNGLHSEAEILGKTDHDFHPPAMANGYRSEDCEVMDSRTPLLNQVWLVYDHRNVQEWFVSSKIPLFDREGNVAGIAGVMRPFLETIDASPYRPFSAAITAVLERYNEKLRVGELAALSQLSISQFDRRFRSLFKMSPSQYILRVRINAVRNQLSRSDTLLLKIAIACGFYDQAQMSRNFKRLTGMTPLAYRRTFTLSRSSQ